MNIFSLDDVREELWKQLKKDFDYKMNRINQINFTEYELKCEKEEIVEHLLRSLTINFESTRVGLFIIILGIVLTSTIILLACISTEDISIVVYIAVLAIAYSMYLIIDSIKNNIKNYKWIKKYLIDLDHQLNRKDLVKLFFTANFNKKNKLNF